MRKVLTILLLCLSALMMQAQITIGGNVYGGGNAGDTGGSTKVTVHAGDLKEVYGGARMANVGGNAFVNIDGEGASDNIFISSVYGGNDIAGTVGKEVDSDNTDTDLIPDELTKKTDNAINNSWSAFVRTSPTPETDDPEDRFSLVIGSLFGGGNGDYDYTTAPTSAVENPYYGLVKPELKKTYLEILGGCIAHLYGGGNNATVTENTTICIDNESPVLTGTNRWPATSDPQFQAKLVALAQRVGLSTYQSNLSSYAFNFARVFGGNNKADMAIRPKWNLQAGVIRDLYSGGNQGAMTYYDATEGHEKGGILLHVNPADGTKLKIENVFGGCRMADVNPAKKTIPAEIIDGTYYPAGYSARVLIEGGDITNVYGGNDISGNIYGGNAVGIHSSIKGDVYGGGNGSYAYTDNPELGEMEDYKDFYYPVSGGLSSVEALRAFRPNAESVSIRLVGQYEKDSEGKVIEESIVPTIIGGAVYCGGNSATLHNEDPTKSAAAELKIGSYVLADKVFLGNNGANMVTENMLSQYAGTVTDANNIVHDYSTMDLASETQDASGRTQFDKYMDGVTMEILPRVVFDDVGSYVPYSTYFGSFYCGGNVGSMKIDGAINISFTDKVVVFDKVVGGSNEANVYQSTYNAQYLGGLIGAPDANGNKLILNFGGLKIEPKRWNSTYTALAGNENFVVGNKYYTSALGDGEFTATSNTTKEEGKTYYKMTDRGTDLVWNTVSANSGLRVAPVTSGSGTSTAADLDRRLKGGNIYGGCYNNGHVEGNVVINLDATIHERDKLFDVAENEDDKNYKNVEKAEENENYYNITKRNTGVLLSQQGTDCFASALNVFGGGYGVDSEIWGSATINLNKGYTFQIFGGGELGAIGKAVSSEPIPGTSAHKLIYEYNPAYSTYINLNGDAALPGVAKNAQGDSPNMAECEYLYGGAFEGVIAGNTRVNLSNGRIFNSFAGSCNADILGHVETYIGSTGFPYVRDYVYGGNDLGGKIFGNKDYTDRIRSEVAGMVNDAYNEQVKKVTAYMEYTQGRTDYILGGGSGNYEYDVEPYVTRVASKPYIHNTFVNFRPNTNGNNEVSKIFGAGEGYPGDRDGDKLQDHSYVLIDIPDGIETFANTEVFGAGAYNGLGMTKTAEETFEEDFDLNEVSAITDLMRGRIGAAYGGSYEQGITRRTMVNVPEGSTIKIGSIFGGAYGSETFEPCDVYEANVNWLTTSENAYLIYNPIRTDEQTGKELGNELQKGAIYGGNNAERRTLYGRININAPVKQKHYKYGWSNATVYGAGCGSHTWSEYTQVNLNEGAKVWEVYGGGEAGGVMSAESAQAYITSNPYNIPDAQWLKAWTLGSGYDDGTFESGLATNKYADNTYTNLSNPLVREAEIDDRADIASTDGKHYKRYNTNVIINEGAYVGNYAYGGGYGIARDVYYGSGDVYGTTYIALLGGTVNKDLYAAGTSGSVYNLFNANFTASANAYIQGGTVRNVYGAGWKGNVGSETLDGETHVVIGNKTGTTFTDGIPAIQRNAYAGGEGETKNGVSEGSTVFGSANITLYKGYIGYTYNEAGTNDETTDIDERYEEKIHDETATDYVSDDGIVGKNRLVEAGNIFGSGYVDHSDVDRSYVTVYDGVVRNSVYGGGEIGCVGRGSKGESGVTISKGGATHVSIYGGLIIGDVFGGGRGYDNLQRMGTLGTAGYIYGTTEVNIHRGRIGTVASVAEGHGNVFGGGNLGYVYGTGTKNASDGYYYNGSNLTEDCKVVVSPYVVVTHATTVNGHSYAVGDFVPTDDLNTLAAGDSNWKTETGGNFDDLGITIGNAVFAGGNVSAGSDAVYANTNTVYGNATASVTDVFNKDLIAIGGDGVGGLYGDGNLTLVDGYRELNITNYGTDYYNLNSSISYDDYQRLNDRERAYFELQYQTKNGHTYSYYRSKSYHNYGDVTYHLNQKITAAEYSSLSSDEQSNWEEGSHTYQDGDKINEEEYELLDSSERANWDLLGFCTLYAGRIMNTIQRADFCGVFGSRIVLRGAQDRVPSAVDYTNYTINRVDELSLNCVTKSALTHGNYFGIYSVVNYLGALTSDVKFSSVRTTESNEPMYSTEHGETYFEWKKKHLNNRKRNNGSSLNEVALSSGVWLEILDKTTETEKKKVYGPITGVVELALINVATGEGGGYVYAKNMHGELISDNSAGQVTLSAANQGAISYKQYTYEDVETDDKMQTSGNFVNSLKRIVDDCYPQSGSFYGADAAPAHYWYIRGEFYLYDQYISAYTGSAQAYAEQVSIPLTITPESQGRLTLKDIHENLYAYWSDDDPNLANYKSQVDDKAIIINDITYHKNDPISYWDYSRLNDAQKAFFLGKTYVSMKDMTLSTGTYTKGQVLKAEEYAAVPVNEYVSATAFTATGGVDYEYGQVINQTQYEALSSEDQQNFESAKSLVHVSNAVSHDNGFLLSFAWDNPDVWNNYYQHLSTGTPQYVRSSKYDSDEFASSRDNYTPSPTFKCNTTGVYGQINYQQGSLVDEQVYNQESPTLVNQLTAGQRDAQAKFENAYVAKADCDFTVGEVHYYYVAGAPVSQTLWDTFGTTNKNLFEAGYICTRTYQISDSEYILNGDVMTATAYNALSAEQQAVMSPAYICTKDGAWGGNYFEEEKNYPAVEFSNLSEAERANFSYNYDALDLLSENFADDGVSAKKYQGMTHGITNQIPYCEKQAIDYTATYGGTEPKDLTTAVEVQRGTSTLNTNTLQTGDVLTNTVYESLVNEQLHYSPIVVSGADAESTVYYVVNEGIQVADNWYNVGNKMSAEIYSGLTENQKAKVTPVPRNSLTDLPTGNATKNYYFCTSNYVTKTQVKDVRVNNNTTYAANQTVPKGAIIGPGDNEGYDALKNEHTGFTIDGIIPTETSTLYVSREIDINDLSQDKIVTVEYWYEYVESDESGSSYETIRERHVVNVHIHFESGVPIIGELLPPRTVLPGDVLGLNQPSVTKGAYEILGGGWETYSSLADAISHKNGTPYVTNQTPMYWYQNGNYVAYYAMTYLGKTYSNAVQFSVANYHDMDKVMQDTEHHMYVDNPRVKRNSKIYIDNRECSSDPTKSELDLFSDFFSLSTGATLSGHEALDSYVTDCQNLDFILYSDVSPKKYNTNWTSIGTAGHCFAGWLHGNGYTVSGLDNSFFGNLCGNIYNVGVMGSFTSGGVADSGSGHIENTWVSTTATPTGKPIIGTPGSGAYVYNSYYPEEQNWTDHTSAANLNIIEKPMADFVNGQVAYLLNSNYLQARYLLFGNKSNASSDNDKVERPVFFSYPDGTFDEETVEGVTQNKEYELSYTKNTTEWPWHSGNGFVEEYMGNGDYRYSDGIIPRQKDVSYSGTELFIPVFPDDYIYFGQTLSYDLYGNGDRGQHDTHPTGIVKYHTTLTGDDVDNSKHLLLSLDQKTANRVFRAPAYFRNGTFGKSVTYNASAAFAASYEVNGANGTTTYKPHEGLTAIDFTGKGDITGYSGVAPGAEGDDFKDSSNSYGPLLDYYGLDAFRTSGITKNLLVYTPSAAAFTGDDDGTAKAQTAATKTLGVLNSYFNEPEYAEKDDNATTGMKAAYRAVNVVPEVNQPKGHLVQMSGGFATDDSRNYSSLTDHFLVDKAEFNCPIEYSFDDGHRMWYQRKPDNYVDIDWTSTTLTTKGWEGISLPFTAELVTTNEKGELTHFYEGSTKGHEYWLRTYTGHVTPAGETDVYADFNPMAAGSNTKDYTNTFLWDYYYSKDSYLDKNTDEYQKQYYSSAYLSRLYPVSNYPYPQAGTPYLVGFPGETYYEFDLSGEWTPSNRYKDQTIASKGKQTITFVSEPGTTINVSDGEMAGVTKDDYTFKPNYLKETLIPVGQGESTMPRCYYLNDTGNAFVDEGTGEITVWPFRPYFETATNNAGRLKKQNVVRRILFEQDENSFEFEDNDPRQGEVGGELIFYVKGVVIGVKSTLRQNTDVLIVNTSGQTIGAFTVHPDETIETPVPNTGVYIVRAAGGKYNRKVTVR